MCSNFRCNFCSEIFLILRRFQWDKITFQWDMTTFQWDMIIFQWDMITYQRDMITYQRDMITFQRDMITFQWDKITFQWDMTTFQWDTITFQWDMITYQWDMITFQWDTITFQWDTITFQWDMITFQWDMITFHVKYPLFLSYFNETWIFFLAYFRKVLKYRFSWKSVSGSRVVLCEQTDRQPNMTKLIVAFRNFANAFVKRPTWYHVGTSVRWDFLSANDRLSDFHEILYRSTLKLFSKRICRKNRASYNLILGNSEVKWGKVVPSLVIKSYGRVENAAIVLNLDTRRDKLSVSRRDRLFLHIREVPCSNPGVSYFLPGSSRRLPGKVGHASTFS
jgi:hypothetical protein